MANRVGVGPFQRRQTVRQSVNSKGKGCFWFRFITANNLLWRQTIMQKLALSFKSGWFYFTHIFNGGKLTEELRTQKEDLNVPTIEGNY